MKNCQRSKTHHQASQMMQQVLMAPPNGAKAHFVQAELSAPEGLKRCAHAELAISEKLAPGAVVVYGSEQTREAQPR